MQTQIHSYSFCPKHSAPITLFGYSTKSLPGLELNGLGKYGKTLKEKIIFLSRSRELEIPLRRFVISSEFDLPTDPQVLKWLDLPVMLLYWYLAGLIPMGRLDNCLAVGSINPSGEIIGRSDLNLKNYAENAGLLLIGSSAQFSIEPKELLGHIPDLSFKDAS
ncbi:MAG: hypothetical protein K2P81_05955 [Bacteriovoracaceae bacterium]|nr:hypothetical protein [Bacteriovoracaceae bacterium]